MWSIPNTAELLTQNSELLTRLAALVDKSLVRHGRAERDAPQAAAERGFAMGAAPA